MAMEPLRWKDCYGGFVELSVYNQDGVEVPGVLFLHAKNADWGFMFDADDAESFAEYLLAWARKQREALK